MLYYIILYYIILYYVILYYIILYYIINILPIKDKDSSEDEDIWLIEISSLLPVPHFPFHKNISLLKFTIAQPSVPSTTCFSLTKFIWVATFIWGKLSDFP